MTLANSQPSADSVTADQVLNHLLPTVTGFEAAFLRGEYALWLGAGISRDRMPDVSKLIYKVLEFVRVRVNVEDPNCPYRRLMDSAVELADLSKDEKAEVNLAVLFADWPIAPTMVRRLGRQYSTLLDIAILGEPIDFLVWDAVDVAGTYADPDVAPDLEHYAVAALVIDGVVSEVVSANWDGLVELAFSELSGGSLGGLRPLIDSDDFRGAGPRAEILKFHGCGVKARGDEERYRSLLVGRRSQITAWPHDEEHVLMRNRMAEIAATKRTLMIGLSGQDTNIQDLFAQAQANFAWPWPDLAPAVLFAEDAVGIDQQNILRVVYRAGYEPDGQAIDAGSLVRAYSKPLLAALFAMTLTSKLGELARLAAPSIISDGSTALRGLSSYFAQRMGTDVEARTLLSDVGRAMMLFSSGALPVPFGRYVPLSGSPANQLEADPMIVASGLPQAALALVALAAEYRPGSWELSAQAHDADSLGPVLRINAGGRVANVWFAANASSAVKLEMAGFVGTDDEDSVLISSDYEFLTAQRSPSAEIGRTGRGGVRRVHMPEVVASASSLDDVREALRGGIGL